MNQLGCNALKVIVGNVQVCSDLELRIQAGDIVAILGANGVGKTTLLHTLAGLRTPDAGQVHLHDQPIENYTPRERARRLGIVFQDHQDPLHASVMQTVLSGRHPFLTAFRGETEQDHSLAMEALRRTGLEDKREMPVSILSGGERKRVALATLLTQRPAVCLLDEPNTHLDLHYQISSLELVCTHVSDSGGSAVMVLHDVNLALRFCHSALLLFGEGDTLQGPVTEIINSENLSRLYRHPMREFRDRQSRCFIPA